MCAAKMLPEAVPALLLNGANFLAKDEQVHIGNTEHTQAYNFGCCCRIYELYPTDLVISYCFAWRQNNLGVVLAWALRASQHEQCS